MDSMETDTLEGGLVDLGGDDAPERAVYEIGYHVVPTVSEESLTQIVSKITDFLKQGGAEFVGERFPSNVELAYSIAKRIDGKNVKFDSAYFGWIAFEADRASAELIHQYLSADENILRFLIVRTDRDAVQAAMSGAVQTIQPTGDIGKPKRDEEAGGEMSEAALDEALKTIETEDSTKSD